MNSLTPNTVLTVYILYTLLTLFEFFKLPAYRAAESGRIEARIAIFRGVRVLRRDDMICVLVRHQDRQRMPNPRALGNGL
jgi:hypothetical protein